MNEGILVKSQRKKGKEPNAIAAIVMAVIPYLFWTTAIVLSASNIEINPGINILMSLILCTAIIYCFAESIRGLIKSEKKILFISALVMNLISFGIIIINTTGIGM